MVSADTWRFRRGRLQFGRQWPGQLDHEFEEAARSFPRKFTRHRLVEVLLPQPHELSDVFFGEQHADRLSARRARA